MTLIEIFSVTSFVVVVVVVGSAVVFRRILDNVRHLSTAKTLLTNYKGIE